MVHFFFFPTVELAELISSDRYHSRIVPSHLMSVDYYPSQIQPNRDFQLPDRAYYGVGLVSDPRIGYSFLNGMNSSARQNLIGATEEETMQNLTLWFSTNVLHGSVDIQLEYPSYCVLNRNFLQDRLKRETISRFSHRQKGIIQPWGCQSASNLFHDLARSVNIPILWVWTCEPIPDSNEYNGHAGLLYHWERSDARLLYHTDDIYLQQLAPFFPSVHDQNVFIERQATDRERAQTYFNTQWAPLSVLESWGFQITYEFSLLPNPHAGIANDDEPNLGVVACTWPPAERGLGGYVSYLLENRYQLGTWMKYLDGYCGYLVWRTQGNNMPTYAASPYGANIQSEASSHSRPLREFEERALACITAYGGCDQLRVLVQEFWDHYGSNTWVKRDQKSMKKRKLPERFRKRRNH